jgi:membrane protein
MKRLIDRARGWLPIRVAAAFGASQAGNYASALAFAGFIAMFPMMLGALSIIGFAIRDPGTEARFQTLILNSFPGNAQPELQNAIHGVRQSAGWLGLASLAGLLWAASGVFSTMEFALAQIFGSKQRDPVRQKLMGLLMMLLLVVAIAITVGANAIAALLPYAWISGLLLGGTVMVLLCAFLYRLVPNRTFGFRKVMPGALLAGVLIEILTLAFPLYARFAGGFNTYGAQFGLFFLLATWFYALSELLLLGAVYNRFRLGQPTTNGLFASPTRESRNVDRPVDLIRLDQEHVSHAPEADSEVKRPANR